MQRTLSFTVVCDDDQLENRLTPPTFRAAVHFEPRLPLAETQSVLATLAQSFHNIMVHTFGPHEFALMLTPEQKLEEDAERAALDEARELRRDGAGAPKDSTDEPLVRLT